jgi:hypothetical protein
VHNDPTNIRGYRILQEIAARALDDEDYRRELIANPNSELEKAGLVVPEGVNVVIHENTRHELHLVLPECPTIEPDDVNIAHISRVHHVF